MGLVKEFREFAMRGNVMDMAVGIVIGVAFGKIISSFVNDVLMPPIGMLLGNVDFSQLAITLREAVAADPATGVAAVEAVTVRYGSFINTVLDFIIVAFCIFMVIKGMNRLKREKAAPAAAPTTKDCPKCCSSIPIKASRCPHCTSEI